MHARGATAILLSVTLLAAAISAVHGATPSSGTASDTNANVTWQGASPPVANSGGSTCIGPNDPACDNFSLTIVPPPRAFNVNITIVSAGPNDCYYLSVFDPAGTRIAGPILDNASSATAALSSPAAGTYTVSVAQALDQAAILATCSGAALAYDATAQIPQPTSGGGSNGTEPLRFITFAPLYLTEPDSHWHMWAPAAGDLGVGGDAPEPSLGVPVKNNLVLQQTQPDLSRVMSIARLQTLRLTIDRATSPPIGTWLNKSSPTHAQTLDPILEVDQVSGRTISSQLLGASHSIMSLSDNDGDTWTDSPQGADLGGGYDHQSVGMGPFPASDPLGGFNGYPTATYYASQDDATALAGLSRDGGMTWGNGSPLYVGVVQCAPLHGHIQVAPDGTVYIPNASCGSDAGLVRSDDAGTTWQVENLHGFGGSSSDTAAAVGSDGTVYYAGCGNGDAQALVSVSTDKGAHWTDPVDVGALVGVKNCVFPAIVAGDGDRAAFAFAGSTTSGATATGADPTAFPGVWYQFVAVTYDRGQSWTVVNASPGDPLQKGSICMQGTLCAGGRNLADFTDVQVDEKGRVLAVYADGCMGSCVRGNPNSGTDAIRIVGQEPGSRTLYAAYDNTSKPAGPVVPLQPYAEAFNTGIPAAPQVSLSWSVPWDGQSPLTNYYIYRRTQPGGSYTSTPLAVVGPSVLNYLDTTVAAGTTYCYKVQSENAVGKSLLDYETCAVDMPLTDVCTLPGAQRGADVIADETGGAPSQLDLQKLFVAEPFLGTDPAQCSVPSPKKVVFTLAIGDATAAANGNSWIILWTRQTPTTDPTTTLAVVQNMVSVRASAAGASCNYGWVEDSPAAYNGVDKTALDPADCVLHAAGVVTISLPTDMIDDCSGSGCHVGPGYALDGVQVRSFAANASGGVVSGSKANDVMVSLGYQLAGNEACRPQPVPTAVDDTLLADLSQSSALLDVLANDHSNGCGALSLVSVSPASNGTVSISGNQLQYQPNGKVCSDQFSYVVTDGYHTATARVTLEHNHQSTATASELIFPDGFDGGYICAKVVP